MSNDLSEMPSEWPSCVFNEGICLLFCKLAEYSDDGDVGDTIGSKKGKKYGRQGSEWEISFEVL